MDILRYLVKKISLRSTHNPLMCRGFAQIDITVGYHVCRSYEGIQNNYILTFKITELCHRKIFIIIYHRDKSPASFTIKWQILSIPKYFDQNKILNFQPILKRPIFNRNVMEKFIFNPLMLACTTYGPWKLSIQLARSFQATRRSFTTNKTFVTIT